MKYDFKLFVTFIMVVIYSALAGILFVSPLNSNVGIEKILAGIGCIVGLVRCCL